MANARLEHALVKLRHARTRAGLTQQGVIAGLIDDAIRLVDAELVEQELVGLPLDLGAAIDEIAGDERRRGYE